MNQYLTELGKNKLRKMIYDVLVKKRDLRLKNTDMGSYEYQAIQQREIAVSILFDSLITCCLLYTSPSPRDGATSRMPSSA